MVREVRATEGNQESFEQLSYGLGPNVCGQRAGEQRHCPGSDVSWLHCSSVQPRQRLPGMHLIHIYAYTYTHIR